MLSQSVAKDPNEPIPHRPQELGLPYGTLWHILHLDLHLCPYKVQLIQQLKPVDIHNIVDTNLERYSRMLSDFVLPAIEEHDLKNV